MLNKKINLEPRIFYAKAGSASEFALQMVSTYRMAKSDFDLGIGYRFGDALEFILGYHLKDWHVFGAYDMTVSTASEYNSGVGGFELGVFKIITKHPKAKVEVKQICPRL